MNRKFVLLTLSGFVALCLPACRQSLSAADGWLHLSSKQGDIPEPGPSTQQTASLVLDVDKDGINDFIIGSRQQGPSIFWYRRVKAGWTKYLVEKETLPIEAGGTFHDIDRDGDLDLVFGADATGNSLWWWENPYPKYDPNVVWKRRSIKNSGANKHHDQIFGDFDGDQQAELVFWNQRANQLMMADIPSDPKKTQPWPYSEIFTSSSESEGLAKADIDGDGKLDIVGGGHWFKHMGGTDFKAKVIDKEQTFTRAAVGQLKPGGRPEVVFVEGEKKKGRLKWYEWNGTAWVSQDLLGIDVDHGHSLSIDDFDGDGNLDVFCAEMRLEGRNSDAKMWFFFGDGKGNFSSQEIATGFGNHESKVADLDGDGDLDILGKPYNWDTPRLDIWLDNNNWRRHVIDTNKSWQSIFITAADIDGDRHKDIITGAWWYKNPGDSESPWQRSTIGMPLNNMAAVYDFDDDGDVDILGTEGKGSDPNANFVWAQNDGSGSFTILDNIDKGEGDFLQGVAINRFQGKQLQVALSWHAGGKGVQMLTVPTDPENKTWDWQRISSFSQDEALTAGDIDLDQDVDLLLGTKWLENNGLAWDVQPIYKTDDSPDRNLLADINQDGRLDVLVGYEAINKEGKVAWYEQPISGTGEWKEHVIAKVIGPMSLDIGDIDDDDDLDVVVGEHNLANPEDAKLYVFENSNGSGTDWTDHVVHVGDEHHDGTKLTDIDADGDLDIISIGWQHGRVILYENK